MKVILLFWCLFRLSSVVECFRRKKKYSIRL